MTDESTRNLLSLIPREEQDRVFLSDSSAEIDPSFLTCLDYEPLSRLIPIHWTVIDFGCSYNAQSYFFQKHKRLISIDFPMSRYLPEFRLERFCPSWCELFECSIDEWMDKHFSDVELDQTFAICGYVPAKRSVERVRSSFENVFVYYPS